jgi:DNA-binding MarR family transcriptional regulator
MKIEDAINQPEFISLAQKASINLLYTSSWFIGELHKVLKPHGITWQQFNIMRILRGQGSEAASLKLITSRMLDRMSNTSRLIDKLVQKGYVQRQVAECDRRQLAITLTEEGRQHLKLTSTSVEDLGSKVFEHLDENKLDMLNNFLNEIREISN